MDLHVANLIGVTVAMTLAAAFPLLFPRIPVPRVVLEIALGALMGPQLLGIVHSGPVLDGLARFGLWIVFLTAGFETNFAIIRGRPLRNAMLGWTISAVLAFGVSALLYSFGFARAPMLTALALSTTSIGILMPVLRESAMLEPPYGPMIFAAGAIGEAAPIVALSLVLARAYAPEQAVIMLAFAAGAVAIIVLAARASSGRFARVVEKSNQSSGQFPMRLTICILVLLVVLSEKLRIDLVLGAFVAGAVVRAALPPGQREIFNARLDGLGSAFAVPIFFVAAGVSLDVRALVSHLTVLLMVPAYAFLMLAVRGLPALLLYRRHLPRYQRLALALHSGTQLSLVVAITGIGVQHGLMSNSQSSAMIGGAVLTLILFPALARLTMPDTASSALHAPERHALSPALATEPASGAGENA